MLYTRLRERRDAAAFITAHEMRRWNGILRVTSTELNVRPTRGARGQGRAVIVPKRGVEKMWNEASASDVIGKLEGRSEAQ